jgi:hypothetical protein
VTPPVGCRDTCSTPEDEIENTDDSLVTKQGWTIALGPWKSLPMNLLILFMAGNQIGLFPIMMVGMMLYRPIQAMLSYKEVFDKLTGDQRVLQKFLYLLANVLILGLGVWKLHGMGLLPTAQSDWVEFIEARDNLEISVGGMKIS